MSNKQVSTDASGSRRSISRSLLPIRNNTIRGASLNHSVITNQLTNSTNTHINQNHAKPALKTLTVISTTIQYCLGKGNN